MVAGWTGTKKVASPGAAVSVTSASAPLTEKSKLCRLDAWCQPGAQKVSQKKPKRRDQVQPHHRA